MTDFPSHIPRPFWPLTSFAQQPAPRGLPIPCLAPYRADPALRVELEELCPNVPSKYQELLKVFSNRQGTTVPLCRSYDHRLKLSRARYLRSVPFIPFQRSNSLHFVSSWKTILLITSFVHRHHCWHTYSFYSEKGQLPTPRGRLLRPQ